MSATGQRISAEFVVSSAHKFGIEAIVDFAIPRPTYSVAFSQDAALAAHAKTLAAFYEKRGRRVTIGSATPGGVVESLQPLRSPNRFPQWKTIAADLILFGTPANNVLLLDQARAQIFPRDSATPAAGRADVLYTRSPFVGEYDVVNVIASDAAGAGEAVKAISAVK